MKEKTRITYKLIEERGFVIYVNINNQYYTDGTYYIFGNGFFIKKGEYSRPFGRLEYIEDLDYILENED